MAAFAPYCARCLHSIAAESGSVLSCSCFLCHNCERGYRDPINNPKKACPGCGKNGVQALSIGPNLPDDVRATLLDPLVGMGTFKEAFTFQIRHYKRSLSRMSEKLESAQLKVQQLQEALVQEQEKEQELIVRQQEDQSFFREASPSPEPYIQEQQQLQQQQHQQQQQQQQYQQQQQHQHQQRAPPRSARSKSQPPLPPDHQQQQQPPRLSELLHRGSVAAPPSPLPSNVITSSHLWVPPPSRDGTVAVSRLPAPPNSRGSGSGRPVTSSSAFSARNRGNDLQPPPRHRSKSISSPPPPQQQQQQQQIHASPARVASPLHGVTPSSAYLPARPSSSGSFHGSKAVQSSRNDMLKRVREEYLSREPHTFAQGAARR